MRRLILIFLLAVMSASALAQQEKYLYRMELVQAAPGRMLDLIDSYTSQAAGLKAAGEQGPLWMRHSQGDHWDLLILWPMASYSDYYDPQHIARRGSVPGPKPDLIAWKEDLFCWGPPITALRKAFSEGGYFHVEMFVALPGSFQDLLHEREMENAYARALHQPENFIFTRDQGAAWDIVTIGVFRDLKHYAASADATPEQQQAAARAAGFDSPAAIGPYLRRFIRTHHDTLAVAIK
jgi:hypothetical protein